MAIDWNYDFYARDWNHGGGLNPEHVTSCISKLRVIEQGGYEATTDGGWPRVGWGEVLDTAMMKARVGREPAFLLYGTYGPSWHPWYMLTSIRKKADRK